ncbi:MAG: hypothetical protein QOG04_409 [Actinomycetota bacterium]|jgi:hypothetical protein|nr:hypothetical protein [Actinomycetota bacterium]
MKRVLAGALLLVLLASCRTETVLVINEDGSGTFTSEIEMENRYFQLLSQEGDPIQGLEDNAKNASFPVTTERLDTDKTKGLRASFEFSDIEDMKAKFAELNNADEQGASALWADATIEETDSGWMFEAEQSGGFGGAESEQVLDPEELDKILDSKTTVTLPGPKGENNATEAVESDGSTTFTWDLNPATATHLSAHTVYPESLLDKLLGPLGLGILGGLILIGGAFFFMKRRTPDTSK